MQMPRIIPLVTLFLAVALMGFGCNPFQKAQEKMQQAAADKIAGGILSRASGGKVSVNSESGQFTYKDNKTGSEMTIGENAKIPDDFPKDVLIYSGAKATSVLWNKTEGSANITLNSGDDAALVLKWYEDRFKGDGWKEEQSTSYNNVEMRQYTKDKVTVTVTVWPNAEEGKTGTFMTLSRSEEKAQPADNSGSQQ